MIDKLETEKRIKDLIDKISNIDLKNGIIRQNVIKELNTFCDNINKLLLKEVNKCTDFEDKILLKDNIIKKTINKNISGEVISEKAENEEVTDINNTVESKDNNDNYKGNVDMLNDIKICKAVMNNNDCNLKKIEKKNQFSSAKNNDNNRIGNEISKIKEIEYDFLGDISVRVDKLVSTNTINDDNKYVFLDRKNDNNDFKNNYFDDDFFLNASKSSIDEFLLNKENFNRINNYLVNQFETYCKENLIENSYVKRSIYYSYLKSYILNEIEAISDILENNNRLNKEMFIIQAIYHEKSVILNEKNNNTIMRIKENAEIEKKLISKINNNIMRYIKRISGPYAENNNESAEDCLAYLLNEFFSNNDFNIGKDVVFLISPNSNNLSKMVEANSLNDINLKIHNKLLQKNEELDEILLKKEQNDKLNNDNITVECNDLIKININDKKYNFNRNSFIKSKNENSKKNISINENLFNKKSNFKFLISRNGNLSLDNIKFPNAVKMNPIKNYINEKSKFSIDIYKSKQLSSKDNEKNNIHNIDNKQNEINKNNVDFDDNLIKKNNEDKMIKGNFNLSYLEKNIGFLNDGMDEDSNNLIYNRTIIIDPNKTETIRNLNSNDSEGITSKVQLLRQKYLNKVEELKKVTSTLKINKRRLLKIKEYVN